MNEKRKEDFRKRLMEDRAQIAGEMISHGGVLERGAQHDFRDLEARAQGISSQWVDDRIAGDDGNLLDKIDLALERLDEGTYQDCANCGGKIPLARLEAKPSASLCVTCQAAKEPR